MEKNKRTLLLEIISILLLKIFGLYILWWVCFSHPIEPQLTKTAITNKIFSD